MGDGTAPLALDPVTVHADGMRTWRGLAISVATIAVLVRTSCGDTWLSISDAWASSPQATSVQLQLADCAGSPPPPPVVTESETSVKVRLHAKDDVGLRACFSGATIRLADPLGTRKVFDEESGDSVRIHFALPFTMLAPTLLPDGWIVQSETGSDGTWRVVYGTTTIGAATITLSLSNSPDSWSAFRGAIVDEVTTVQGRGAIWVRSADLVDGTALVVRDDPWTLVVSDDSGTLGHARVEAFAAALAPLPFPPAVAAPNPPTAWTGSVAEVAGKQGATSVTAWLLVDAAGRAALRDEWSAESTRCSGPSIAIDWYSGDASVLNHLIDRGDVRTSNGPITLTGILKDDILSVGA
jgi:hypothetical protein